MTPREAETLWWTIRGAATAETAERMGIAPTTAKKHLERVYRKLGVSSRGAAVAMAFDFVNQR